MIIRKNSESLERRFLLEHFHFAIYSSLIFLTVGNVIYKILDSFHGAHGRLGCVPLTSHCRMRFLRPTRPTAFNNLLAVINYSNDDSHAVA